MISLLHYIKEDIFDIDDKDRLVKGKPIFFGGELKRIKNEVCEFDSPGRNSVTVDAKIHFNKLQEIINAFKIDTFKYISKNSYLNFELRDANDFKNLTFECENCYFMISEHETHVHNLNVKSNQCINYSTYGKQKYNTIFENCDFECSNFNIEGSAPTFHKSNLKFEKIVAESKQFHGFIKDVIYNYKNKSQIDMGKSLFFGANLECSMIDSEYKKERIILTTKPIPSNINEHYTELGTTGWYFAYL